MRKTTQDYKTIQAAEKAVEDRRLSRATGFAKIDERDRNYTVLKNYAGGRVIMRWNLSDFDNAHQRFMLTDGNRNIVLDAEELRRSLRWV